MISLFPTFATRFVIKLVKWSPKNLVIFYKIFYGNAQSYYKNITEFKLICYIFSLL